MSLFISYFFSSAHPPLTPTAQGEEGGGGGATKLNERYYVIIKLNVINYKKGGGVDYKTNMYKQALKLLLNNLL